MWLEQHFRQHARQSSNVNMHLYAPPIVVLCIHTCDRCPLHMSQHPSVAIQQVTMLSPSSPVRVCFPQPLAPPSSNAPWPRGASHGLCDACATRTSPQPRPCCWRVCSPPFKTPLPRWRPTGPPPCNTWQQRGWLQVRWWHTPRILF